MDFEADSVVGITDDKLKTLSKLATQQLYMEQEILQKDEELKVAKEQLKYIAEVKMPEAMQSIGMSSFKLSNGAGIEIKPFFAGKIDDENREATTKWLHENGHGALLQKQLIISFGQKEGIDWNYLINSIKTLARESEGVEVDTEIKQGVHHKTLNAFIKEQVTSGKEFPLTLFKAFVGNKSKISF